jgi:ubiquinol oxidase
MKLLNTVVLNLTVAVIDFLYMNRDIQRFWVLEEIARAPYFSFLSVLHLPAMK